MMEGENILKKISDEMGMTIMEEKQMEKEILKEIEQRIEKHQENYTWKKTLEEMKEKLRKIKTFHDWKRGLEKDEEYQENTIIKNLNRGSFNRIIELLEIDKSSIDKARIQEYIEELLDQNGELRIKEILEKIQRKYFPKKEEEKFHIKELENAINNNEIRVTNALEAYEQIEINGIRINIGRKRILDKYREFDVQTSIGKLFMIYDEGDGIYDPGQYKIIRIEGFSTIKNNKDSSSSNIGKETEKQN